MDKEMLEILKRLETKVDGIETKVDGIETKVSGIENKLNGVVEQTADLLEFRIETSKKINQIKDDVEAIKKDLCFVEEATAKNWRDIANLRAVK